MWSAYYEQIFFDIHPIPLCLGFTCTYVWVFLEELFLTGNYLGED